MINNLKLREFETERVVSITCPHGLVCVSMCPVQNKLD